MPAVDDEQWVSSDDIKAAGPAHVPDALTDVLLGDVPALGNEVIFAIAVLRARRAGGSALIIRRAAGLGACVALIGGIEWALDKTPVSNVLLYGVMIAACAAMYACAARFRGGEKGKRA